MEINDAKNRLKLSANFLPFCVPNTSECLKICFLHRGCRIEEEHMGLWQAFACRRRGKSHEVILGPLG